MSPVLQCTELRTACFPGDVYKRQLDIPFYTTRHRDENERFPWDFIDIGVTKKFLLREWKRAHEETVTPNCRQQCQGCGAGSYHAGCCPTAAMVTGGENA